MYYAAQSPLLFVSHTHFKYSLNGTLWIPVVQVEVVVNAQWFHGYHTSPIPNP